MEEELPRQRDAGEGEAKTLRKLFDLKTPVEGRLGESGENHTISSQKKNDNPFFRDPLILPKVNRHLRVKEG
jgi:hypothetical protein